MNLVNSLNRVQQLLDLFELHIRSQTAIGRTDLNKAAETILIPLLNEVYDWNLVNANYIEDDNNYPGIDLVDKASRVCVQVTATTSVEKVKHTLEQFIKHEHYLEYNRVIIFFLKEKQNYRSKTIQSFQNIVQDKIDFNIERDTWDWRNLLKEISNFQIERVNRVREILEANFGDDRPAKSEQEINWRETCQTLLEQWKGLTTNALTKPDGVRFQLDDVFVPLGVVERKKQPRRAHSEVSPERGSELYEEKVTPISHDDFFENVLRQGQSEYSQGRRIAIIGEPGAGKTTQLQKIGDWILQKTDGIPIWIPLSVVEEKGLKEYLVQDWLQSAISELKVTERHQDDLAQLLQTGKVWLLLDGVDEMMVADALHHMATQVREMWLQNVRVVLTCRLNVWEAGKNALDSFDVYRNLDFEYPGEIHQFIDKWFQEKPGLQQMLKTALEQPGKERIRDMAKNPLRLTLLCYSWQMRQGELPETKAGLYEWFVDAFYKWNKGKVPFKLTSAKRRELNQALGELAREAIDQTSSRFRLKEKFVTCFLGNVDDEDSLFHLALQLGWLNRIGVATENPFEGVYAFFHPTFQEYFAALAINNHKYFLNHIQEHPSDGTYRIFETQWEEVFLLSLGDWDNDTKNMDFQELVNELVNFEDGCRNIYWYRALFIATSATPELPDNMIADQIIEKSIKIAFGFQDNERWTAYPTFMREQAKIFLERGRTEVVDRRILEIIKKIREKDILDEVFDFLRQRGRHSELLANYLEAYLSSDDTNKKLMAARSLLKSNRHKIAVNTLKNLARNENEDISIMATWSLHELQDKQEAYNYSSISETKREVNLSYGKNEFRNSTNFIKYLRSYTEDFIVQDLANALENLSNCKLCLSENLLKIAKEHPDYSIKLEAINWLQEITPADPLIRPLLLDLALQSHNDWVALCSIDKLLVLEWNHSDIVEPLIILMWSSEESEISEFASEMVSEFFSKDPIAIEYLIYLLKHEFFPSINSVFSLQCLKKIITIEGCYYAVCNLSECLSDANFGHNQEHFKACYEIVWHCAQLMKYQKFHEAWHTNTS